MSTRAYYRPRGVEVDMADLPRWLYDEIASLHGATSRSDAPLVCLANDEPMYIFRNHYGRFFPRHYPNGSHPGSHGHLATMSDEHRRQTDYTQRAASDHGFEAVQEYSTGNGTRLDLAVTGLAQVGFEIQRSTLSRAKARSRAAKSFDAGWPTAWVTDGERAPDWADQVPTARLTAGIDWTSLPSRNSAYAIIGDFVRVRDTSKRSGWAYRRKPRKVLLDELAYLMPAGEVVPVRVGTKGAVSLASRQSVDVIDSCTYPGASAWKPVAHTVRAKEAAQQISRECGHTGTAALTLPRECEVCLRWVVTPAAHELVHGHVPVVRHG